VASTVIRPSGSASSLSSSTTHCREREVTKYLTQYQVILEVLPEIQNSTAVLIYLILVMLCESYIHCTLAAIILWMR